MLKLHIYKCVYIYSQSCYFYNSIHIYTHTHRYMVLFKILSIFSLNYAQTMAYSLRKEQVRKKYYILHSSNRLNGTESTKSGLFK